MRKPHTLPEDCFWHYSDFVKENLVSQFTLMGFCRNLAERKEMMMEYADIFVVLPADLGHLMRFSKYCQILMELMIRSSFLNSNGFYNDLFDSWKNVFWKIH